MKITPDPQPRLLFVYNADTGLAAALFDSAHKLLSPGTYSCNLCALTHGLAGPKKQWSEFLRTLAVPPRFLHRDEFLRRHPSLRAAALPAIFAVRNDEAHLLADAETLGRIDSLEGLIRLVKEQDVARPPLPPFTAETAAPTPTPASPSSDYNSFDTRLLTSGPSGSYR